MRFSCAFFIVALIVISLAYLDPCGATMSCDANQAIIDGKKIPFGASVDCEGEFSQRDFMELSPGEGDLKLARMNGRGNQDHITVHLSGLAKPDSIKPGQWLKVHGKLADGKSAGAWSELSVAVDSTELISPAPLTPADFLQRTAEFEGTAVGPADLKLSSTSLRVTAWPVEVLGKHVAIHGLIHQTPVGFSIDAKNDWHLIDPQDMVGRTATLEGFVWDLNGVWGFKYRDFQMIITDDHDHPVVLDGNRHYTRAKVTGLLVNQLRPSLEQISLKTDRNLDPTFVLRRAKIEYAEPEIDEAERFRDVYPATRTTTDGVPDLVARDIVRRNIMGNETESNGFLTFNYAVIKSILANPSPAVLDVLAKRANTPTVTPAMQLVYATMLAAVNDPRGRDRLKAAVQIRDDNFSCALYCMGAFSTLLPEASKIKTDAAWAEPVMVSLMTEKDDTGTYATAALAIKYSEIPGVLADMNTPAGREALFAFVVADEPTSAFRPNMLRIIAGSGMTLSRDQLLKLESVRHDDTNRRSILHIAIKQNDAEAASRFFSELGQDNWFQSEFTGHLTPEIIKQLSQHQNQGSEKARASMHELLLCSEKDPVPDLIKLLDDPKWSEKYWLMWQLAKYKDPRCIAPVLRILKQAAPDYFGSDYPDNGVNNAINAIASAQTRESTSALIELLDLDLSRFGGTMYHRDDCQRLVAIQLIDNTGESFGTDATAWRK